MEHGYIQIYTGDGKGKTTAALGLALRAAGAGLSVFIAQFVKGQKYSELNSISRFNEEITLRQYGRTCFIHQQPQPEDFQAARAGWDEVTKLIHNNAPDLLILDELNIALYYQLLNLEEIIVFLKNKPLGLEIVITGRKMPEELLSLADLVTEMKEIRHYYQQGVEARKGIEF